MTHTVAALFVSESGPYINRSNIDAWTISRDARTYPGPLPVIAHHPANDGAPTGTAPPHSVGTNTRLETIMDASQPQLPQSARGEG